MRFVEARQRAGGGTQQLEPGIPIANLVQPLAQVGDRLVVRVQEAALRQQRVRERVVNRPFDGVAKLRARHQDGVHVDAVGIERQAPGLHALVIHGDENQIDVGAVPHCVVRQAAAENGRQHGRILTHLCDERVERCGESMPDLSEIHGLR